MSLKRAFSLMELILVLVILGVCVVIFAKPLLNIAHFYATSESKGRNLGQINAAFIQIEKILQNCLEFNALNSGFECLSKDSNNLVLQRANSLFIGTSGVLLKDENGSFYAPKSHFIYEFSGEKGEVLKGGVLVNQNELHGTNADTLMLYELNSRTKHEIKPLGKTMIKFTSGEFGGFYELIDGLLSVKMQGDELIYSYAPIFGAKIYSGVLVKNAAKFSINEENEGFLLEICTFETQKTSENLCLKRWIRK